MVDIPVNKKVMALWVAVVIILASITVVYYFETNQVEIKDAYCLNNTFQFTLKNLRSETVSVDYRWTLNDPMADSPVHDGKGSVSLDSREQKTLNFTFTNPKNYDSRFYIMYIYVFKGGRQIEQYSQQKSSYDWDYSVRPPVQMKDFNPFDNNGDYFILGLLIVITILVVVIGFYKIVHKARKCKDNKKSPIERNRDR